MGKRARENREKVESMLEHVKAYGLDGVVAETCEVLSLVARRAKGKSTRGDALDVLSRLASEGSDGAVTVVVELLERAAPKMGGKSRAKLG